ncbi:MAG: hypothetical protein ACNA8R_03605 [Nitriliruptoraceae bacterium]
MIAARPVDDDGTPLPTLLRRDHGRRLRTGDVLYRLYLTVLFGGMYGGAIVHAIVTVPTPAASPMELVWLGLVLASLPGVAVLVGANLGDWIGLVPVTPAEAAVLLPTPVRRRALLRPRALRATAALVMLVAASGVVAAALLALQRTVGPSAWLATPVLGAALATLLAAAAVRTQLHPRVRGRPWRVVGTGLVAVSLPLLLAAVPTGRQVLAGLASAVLRAPDPAPVVAMALAGWVATTGVASVGIRRLDGAHDEELRARAGLHTGVGASLKLGDLRAVRLSREPTSRARPGRRLPLPTGGPAVVAWRHRRALRARPGGLVRVVAGWAAATALVVGPEPPSTATGATLRVLVAGGLAYAATVPLLEPLRRDHDAPLAAELLPFGYAHLQRLHVRATWSIACVVIVPTTTLSQLLLAPDLPWWSGLAGGVLAASCAVLAGADRVRQPGTLAESVATMPVGATPEVLGVAVAGSLLLPVLAMVPAGLPIGFALASPLLPVPAAPVVAVTALAGVLLLGLRWLGLRIWLDAAEAALADASVPEPGSSLPLAWRRLQDRRRR